MSSSADPSSKEAAMRKQNKGPPFKFLFPLVYAPVLPLIRLSLRRNPVLRDRVFTIVLAGALAHGAFLVYPFLSLVMIRDYVLLLLWTLTLTLLVICTSFMCCTLFS